MTYMTGSSMHFCCKQLCSTLQERHSIEFKQRGEGICEGVCMKQQITPSPAPVLPWLLQESLRIFYYSFPIVCNVHTTKTCFLLFVPRTLQSTVMGDTGLRVCMLYHIR